MALRALAAGLLVALCVLTPGCGEETTGPPPPQGETPPPSGVLDSAIVAFVEAEPLPEFRQILPYFSTAAHLGLSFFQVSYGTEWVPGSNAFSSRAVGLEQGSKIGWLGVWDEEGVDLEALSWYAVDSADSALFDDSFWELFRTSHPVDYWEGFLPHLARTEGTPGDVLLRITGLLSRWHRPRVAEALLENPVVRASPEILWEIGRLPVFPEDGYGDARAEAWILLYQIDGIPSQEYLFEISYLNFAWGYLHLGLVIDRNGDIWSYDVSDLDPRFEDPADGIYTQEQLDFKFGHERRYLETIGEDRLARMYFLIEPASEGELSDPVNRGHDAGAMSYLGYLYDEETGLYHRVLFYQGGDFEVENTSEAGRTGRKLLYEIGRAFGLYPP
jgi:hypothetical protein